MQLPIASIALLHFEHAANLDFSVFLYSVIEHFQDMHQLFPFISVLQICEEVFVPFLINLQKLGYSSFLSIFLPLTTEASISSLILLKLMEDKGMQVQITKQRKGVLSLMENIKVTKSNSFNNIS